MREVEIVEACKPYVIKQSGNDCDYTFSTDSRNIKTGEIYLPLKGVNFDGEDFIEDALKKGALGYFTTKNLVYENARTIFQVESTLQSYLELANFYKNKINPIVIGITGSSGKTTTKEMVYSVVSQKFNTVKTFSNHNNEIGFCQTVFEMKPDTQVLIIEMGMRGLGEISLISKYAQPDYAIITNSGSAHVGRLGSIENIAKAKCEIAEFLNPQGAFIALNQPIIKDTVNYQGEKIYFSLSDVKILEKNSSYSKFIYKNKTYELNIEGDYNIENALSAIEIGYKLGLSYEEINRGLALYKPLEKRWEVQEINGMKLINDSYNANPESMKVAVKTFIEFYQNPVVVLGNMGELGDDEIRYHKEVGHFIAQLNIFNAVFLTVGELAKNIGIELENLGKSVLNFKNNKEIAEYLLKNFNSNNTIFLKASRAMKFEEIIEYLKRGKL